jgi:two-component system chemotaxis response regulator CheB
LTRKYLEKTLSEMGFEAIAVASASEATNYLNFNEVDLITLDLNMPGVGGDKWLQEERRDGLKTPVVILSEAHSGEVPAVVRLLALGAQDYIEKSRMAAHPGKIKELLIELIRASQTPNTELARGSSASFPKIRPELVLIGASTGGPQALVKILSRLPADSPPIVITQHISPKFAKPLAERLTEVSGLKLGQPDNDTRLEPGHLYMSFGDYHLAVDQIDKKLVLKTSTSQAFNGHRPSVDFLFNSVLGIERPMMALLLTGMGRDGALGLRFLHHEGVFCIAQSEEDCIVYGMPREAVERGAVDFVGNQDENRSVLLNSFQLLGKRAA